jgi:cell division transport system permease protein
MGNFVRYATRETLTNLWRNRLMTMAAVLTVTVSLGLVGAALYLKQGAAQASASWERQTQVQVWMKPSATAPQLAYVKQKLYTSPYLSNCSFWSRLKDYQEAKSLLPPQEWFILKPQTTPSSYRCTPVQPGLATVVTNTASQYSGVFAAIAPVATIHEIQTTVNILQGVLLAIALVLMISAGVLILNTIRMAIFARRREVSVMKLVGATNWFIRVPFIAEGMIQGILGALLASAIVYGIHVTVDHLSNAASPLSLATEMRLTGWHVFGTDVVIVLIGAGIGALGSALAVRRFLDV